MNKDFIIGLASQAAPVIIVIAALIAAGCNVDHSAVEMAMAIGAAAWQARRTQTP